MRAKPSRFLILTLVSVLAITMLLLLSACDMVVTTETPELKADTPAPASANGTPEPTSTVILEEFIEERTPMPTAMPGAIQEEVEKIVARVGLARTQFLGLKITDWVSLLLSIVYILIGYFIGTLVVKRGLKRFIEHAPAGLDQELLKKIFSDLRWLVTVVIAYFATKGLVFFSDTFRTLLWDLYYVIGMIFAYRVASMSISLAEDWYRQKSVAEDREEELAPVITLLARFVRVIVVVIGLTILLSHFGINVSALATALGIGGLAISLAARDTIADAIAGFIILVDQPFRIGDRIEIQGVDTWGDVIEIGLRTTRIRTRDNRMVIVPNSIIGSNQVINYTYPDPRYRIETHVGVAYGTDIESLRELIIDTVSKLDFVLPDKPVDALYIEMGDSAMIFRVRWWIESYVDTRRVIDHVNTALQEAFDDAGIESPYPTQSIKMQVEPDTAEHFSQALKDSQKGTTESGE